jgi:putative transposase
VQKTVRFEGRGEARSRVSVQVPIPLLACLRSAEEDFLSLCVETGRQVLRAMMEGERTELCGPKWQPNPDRTAVRAGTAPSEVTLGGRRIPLRRLRARSVDGRELALPSFAFAASRDPLDRHTMAAISRGVSTRGYADVLEALPESVTARAI